MDIFSQLPQSQILFVVVFAWSLLWKGIALWKAAKQEQRNWFIAILVLNTIGILEIAFLFYFSKRKLTLIDLQFWKKS